MQGGRLQSPSRGKHLQSCGWDVWLWKKIRHREINKKKLALTRFELARFPITDWTEPKRDAITTRPQYRDDFAAEEE